MSKYDFEINLSDNSSTGLIIKRIKPGSVVLEFGCATGRMTRYLSEELGCQVYIVELEQEAFDVAKRFAVGGICGDILEFKWVEAFSGMLFDHIIFADVLEHLIDPLSALEISKGFLKDNGNILISIPNITHNDILLKIYSGKFDYTPTGLLDDTHVHFWGYDNFVHFVTEAGLFVAESEATFCETGFTEQYAKDILEIPMEFRNRLRSRETGEIYQFIFVLTKDEQKPVALPEYHRDRITISIYYDRGNDFNQNDLVQIQSGEGVDLIYHVDCSIEITEDIKRLRFDPIEGQGCIIDNFRAAIDDCVITPSLPFGFALDERIFIDNNDPYVIIDTSHTVGVLNISADIILFGESFYNAYNSSLLELSNRYSCVLKDTFQKELCLKKKDSVIESMEQQLKKNNEYISELEESLINDKEIIHSKSQENRDLDNIRKNLLDETIALKRDIDAYIALANAKDSLIIEYKNKINYYENVKSGIIGIPYKIKRITVHMAKTIWYRIRNIRK